MFQCGEALAWSCINHVFRKPCRDCILGGFLNRFLHSLVVCLLWWSWRGEACVHAILFYCVGLIGCCRGFVHMDRRWRHVSDSCSRQRLYRGWRRIG